MGLAQGWLCEPTTVPLGERPCGACASCRLVQARSHPDLLVLVPEALREALGLSAGEGDEGSEEPAARKKPSKEIRVERVRVAIAFSLTTSARGRGKVVVVHPAERMNPVAANAFLKTLEEPPGDARFLLCSAAPGRLLPTIRSRCQALPLRLPPEGEAIAWLAAGHRRTRCPAGSLRRAAAGGLGWRAEQASTPPPGVRCPRRIANGDAAALRGWPLPAAVDALQKLCHDAASIACRRGAPLLSARRAWRRRPSRRVAALVRASWPRGAQMPSIRGSPTWHRDLVAQGQEALQTPRSPRREARRQSLHSGALNTAARTARPPSSRRRPRRPAERHPARLPREGRALRRLHADLHRGRHLRADHARLPARRRHLPAAVAARRPAALSGGRQGRLDHARQRLGRPHAGRRRALPGGREEPRPAQRIEEALGTSISSSSRRRRSDAASGASAGARAHAGRCQPCSSIRIAT